MSSAPAVSPPRSTEGSAGTPERRPLPRWLLAVALVGTAAGAGLRILFLVLPGTGALDSDEAVTGLMALHALRDGEVSAFFWGQAYGGSLEPLLAVPVVAVLGASTLAVKVVPITLSAVAAVLVWRIGRRTAGEHAGVVAAVAMWTWPATMVWFSTKGRGFYWVCLVAGLTMLLLALRLVRRPDDRVGWVAIGVAGGIGWWSSPQIVYFALPAVLWLVVVLRRDAWRLLALAGPAAVLGASPWLAFNVANGWSSLRATSRTHDEGLVGNLWVLVSEGIPVILGLEVGGRPIVPVVAPVAYVALAGWVAWSAARRPAGLGLVVLGALAFPLAYAAFPVSGVVGEGRYVLFLLPYLALLLAHAARNPGRLAAFVVVAVALSAAAVPRIEGGTAPLAVDRLVPPDLTPVLDLLEERGVDAVLADYWLAYRIAYESDEEVVAAPINDLRYRPGMEAVLRNDRPAWVFVEGTYLIDVFEQELARRGVAAEVVRTGGFVVYLPEERVVCWPTDPLVGVPCG